MIKIATINIDKIPIKEPEEPIRFRSRYSLLQHVQKHVLNQRDERWSQLIDADQLAESRQEAEEIENESARGKNLTKTMQEYVQIISKALLRLTKEGKSHFHLYQEPPRFFNETENEEELSGKLSDDQLPDKAVQIIEAWDIVLKTIIIAKSFVINGKFVPYVLCSAYRPFPKLSGNSLHKTFKRLMRERKTINTVVLAEHDNEVITNQM
ncbi:MAG: hypothetical protein LBJ67_11365 [Planctomycetaceae bacterium]|jgi:hypothetical protein|nr:hypothetical protein [Planctomycetaceae bacterium]